VWSQAQEVGVSHTRGSAWSQVLEVEASYTAGACVVTDFAGRSSVRFHLQNLDNFNL
jgi:hypothetical protein